MAILHTNRDIQKIRISPLGGPPFVWIIFGKEQMVEIDDKYVGWFKDVPGFWIEDDEPIVILDYNEVDLL